MALTLEQVARYPRPGTVVPGRVAFTPDGRAVTFLQSADGSLVRSLWRHDIATAERRVLAGPDAGTASQNALSREAELRRERARQRELGVTEYHVAEHADPTVLLVPSPSGVAVARGEGLLRPLPGTAGVEDPRLSPDGRRIAFVRAGDLYSLDLADSEDPADGEPRRLTHDAEDGLTNGLADYIAAEELDRDRGFWWSPDSDRLAFVRADSRHIPSYPIVHQGREAPDVEHHRYPFAGARNAVLRLGVVAADGRPIRWMNLGADDDQYLPRVAWRPDGTLAARTLARDQRSARWLTFGPDGVATVLVEDRGEPWLNVTDDDTRFLASGEILRGTEASGFHHLELLAADGTPVRRLTDGDWLVSRLVGADEARREAWFVATREGPRERHLYRVSLDGGHVARLSDGRGWHDAVLARDGEHYVESWSSVDHPPIVTLRRHDGSAVALLHHEAAVTPAALGVAVPRFVELPGPGGITLHGALYRASSSMPGVPPQPGARAGDAAEPAARPADAAEPAPLIVAVYGGPHAQTVTDQWAMTVDLRAQYLARCGFTVFKLDNRGSAGRGLAFEAHLDRAMGTVEIEDQAAGVRWLVAQGIADPERVGIYGWSYGGYATLMALLREPGLFRVGVAGAPVTDWGGYDTGYTERYLGKPVDEPDAYRQASVLTYAEQLRGAVAGPRDGR